MSRGKKWGVTFLSPYCLSGWIAALLQRGPVLMRAAGMYASKKPDKYFFCLIIIWLLYLFGFYSRELR